jgi:hypothetical protein
MSLQPRWTCGVLRLQLLWPDEQLLAQILTDGAFALGLGQPTHRVEVVGLNAIEIVLGLRTDGQCRDRQCEHENAK